MPEGDIHEKPRAAGQGTRLPVLALAAATMLAVVSYGATAVVISGDEPREGLGPVPAPPQGWMTVPASFPAAVPVSVLPAPTTEAAPPSPTYRRVRDTGRKRASARKPKPSPTPSRSPAPLLKVGATVGLSPVAFPDYRIRHRNFVARVDLVTSSSSPLDRADSQFVVRAGLADQRCHSFESVNYPGFHLRHSSYTLRLDPYDQTSAYGQDVTFCATATDGGFTLASANHPTRRLLVAYGLLRLEEQSVGQPTVFRAVPPL